ncbi:hypothetical protein [Nonomuraea sp. SYSU D8015]|uniref:hypothetical protein n=1 Tax=Nonomuraea sp. SYSU D8015 TaxID=2593644 RepID=UPI0016609C78|nr:hypothetical protein [Nonomuraea sp. SYSU D8015]
MKWIIAAVLLVAVGLAQRLLPDADRMYRPIASTGGINEEVRTAPYSVRVDGVRTGRELQVTAPSGEVKKVLPSKGVWVTVQLTATATKEPVSLQDVMLEGPDGTVYAAGDGVFGLNTANLEAGIPQAGSIAFEVPPGLKSAVLRITGPQYSSALGPAVEIDLGTLPAPVPTASVAEVES